MSKRVVYDKIAELNQILRQKPIGTLFLDENKDIKTLSALYNTKIDKNSIDIPNDISFRQVLRYEHIKQELIDIYNNLFEYDINTEEILYLMLCLITNVILPQSELITTSTTEKEIARANPDGTVSRGEFFDCLNAIEYKANCINDLQMSVDNLVYPYDYFNMGYNRLCKNEKSVLYSKLTRIELIQPISWLELLYYLTFAYEPICDRLGLFDLDTYDFSKFLREDIEQADTRHIKLGIQQDEAGYIKYDIVEKPVTDYYKDIISKKHILPYIHWFTFLRLLDIDIIDISFDKTFQYITRGQFSKVLVSIAEFLTEE